MVRYCADTSSIVAAYVERYPIDHFPGLWAKFGEMITAGEIFAPDEVRTELNKRSKEAAEWLDGFNSFFIPTDLPVVEAVQDILDKFPKLVMERKIAYAADPFVIGLASLKGATVLSEEGAGSIGKPKIPIVCKAFGVPCCSLLELIRSKTWVLG